MKRLLKKITYRFFNLTLMIVLLVGMMFGFTNSVQATAYLAGSMSDTMTNIRDNTAADHSIRWTLPSGINFDVTGNTDTMRVDFDDTSGFTQSGTWQTTDFTLTANNGARTLTVIAVDQSAAPNIDCAAGVTDDEVCIAVETDTHIFTIKPSSGFTATTADQYFVFGILGASGGTGVLTNPNVGADGNFVTTLAECDEDAGPCTTTFTSTHSGSLAVDIELNSTDQVTVSATVDPSITLTLSTNAINLGTLATGSVSSQTMTSLTATNAVGGYSSTLLENNDLRIDGSNNIDDVGIAGTIDAGTEEYGMSTDDGTDGPFDIITDADCASVFNADPITATAQTYAGDTSGPVAGETTTLCFAASINATTAAGSYTHTLTFVTTGIF